MAERRRAITTIALGPHVELFEIARPLLERYALRHGYDLVVQRENVGDRPPAWQKIPLLLSLLDSYETVVWVDADAIVVDPSDDIASTPDPRPIQLVFHRIDGVVVPNCGVMVVRRMDATRELLGRMWARHELIDHRWWENAALIAAIGGDPDRGLTTRRSIWRSRRWLGPLDPRWNSVPPCPAPDPAIVHLAGVSHAERVSEMTRLAATAGDLGVSTSTSRVGSVR